MTWQPGDKLLCIKSGTRTTSGAVYTLAILLPKGTPVPGTDFVILRDILRVAEVDYPAGGFSSARRFIKIDPKLNIELEKEHEHA